MTRTAPCRWRPSAVRVDDLPFQWSMHEICPLRSSSQTRRERNSAASTRRLESQSIPVCLSGRNQRHPRAHVDRLVRRRSAESERSPGRAKKPARGLRDRPSPDGSGATCGGGGFEIHGGLVLGFKMLIKSRSMDTSDGGDSGTLSWLFDAVNHLLDSNRQEMRDSCRSSAGLEDRRTDGRPAYSVSERFTDSSLATSGSAHPGGTLKRTG
jgi:hypothetical protein